ncbi:DUF5666 domain-containing protein [Candidatus Venteria ishoeyi]|uniref:DUF5666 domain-containing protein n=1 Tax=Candidatus Venteria ishoeyi TaxID=1899563 RepID=A0A1H6FA63_9GAMM|nr:DUF5666 domain-containing protein [Candidatus Venteria ishoeyi]SEH07000.1 Uncharacterised protein [Candidatus Venteria ishoeyi]
MKPHKIITIASILLSLWGCSGGGLSLAEGGVEGTGLGVGSISAFGSIVVNDIKYETEQAELFINGVASDISQLHIGMFVSVTGEDKQAQTIQYYDLLRAKLRYISDEGKSLILAGHTVLVDDNTALQGFSDLQQLQIDDCLRVSGLALGTKGIPATFIQRLPAQDCEQVIVSGLVSHLDLNNQYFYLAGLKVSSQNPQSQVPLKAGLAVTVMGAMTQTELTATHIIGITPLKPVPHGIANIHGTITNFNNSQDFSIEHQPARIDPNSDWSSDILAQLQQGAQVNLRAKIAADGVLELTPEQLQFSNNSSSLIAHNEPYRISGELEYIDMEQQQLTVAGIRAYYHPQTQFRDITEAQPRLHAQHLRLGDSLTIAGFQQQNDLLELSQVFYEPFTPANQRQLQGLVTQIDQQTQTLWIFNHPIQADPQSEFFDIRNQNITQPPLGVRLSAPENMQITATEFFQSLAQGSLVYVFAQVLDEQIIVKHMIVMDIED